MSASGASGNGHFEFGADGAVEAVTLDTDSGPTRFSRVSAAAPGAR